MKTPLDTEVDLGPGHFVFDGVPGLRERGTAAPCLFGPYLLWPRSRISATAELLSQFAHSVCEGRSYGVNGAEDVFVSVICCSCNMRSCIRRLCRRAIKLRDKIAGVTSVIQIIIAVSTTAYVNHGWTSYLLVIIMAYSLHIAKLTVS